MLFDYKLGLGENILLFRNHLVSLKSRGFTAGHAALKTVACKVTKHENVYIENQHLFILFVFDTFGFLVPKAVEFFNRVQQVMHSNIKSHRSIDIVFKRIHFVIQK